MVDQTLFNRVKAHRAGKLTGVDSQVVHARSLGTAGGCDQFGWGGQHVADHQIARHRPRTTHRCC